jgi:hypothetical protein
MDIHYPGRLRYPRKLRYPGRLRYPTPEEDPENGLEETES